MASSRDYSFLKFLIFFLLLQQGTLNCKASSEGCAPTFKADQKISVEMFFAYDNGGAVSEPLCRIINASNGLISMVYRMGDDISVDSNGKVVCSSEDQCHWDRKYACYYKYYKDIYNDCNKSLPDMNEQIDGCMRDKLADDILVSNKNAYVSSKATVSPALVVDGTFYSCFTDYSFDSMKSFFCKAFNNGLPVCSG